MCHNGSSSETEAHSPSFSTRAIAPSASALNSGSTKSNVTPFAAAPVPLANGNTPAAMYKCAGLVDNETVAERHPSRKIDHRRNSRSNVEPCFTSVGDCAMVCWGAPVMLGGSSCEGESGWSSVAGLEGTLRW